jgi:prephenate dehydrogenase
MKPEIGIIGGNGKMGRMFFRFFEGFGLVTHAVDIGSDMTLEACAQRCQVVVVSVPSDHSVEIIRKVGPLMEANGLLMDVTSLKTEPLQAMLDCSSCEVVGTHPVFGPRVRDFANQTVVVCPGRGERWKAWLIDLLKKNQARVKECSAQEHDRMMAVIQGMIHFSTITMGHVFRELDVDVDQSLTFSSPIYKIRLDMIGRILNQSAELYGDIEMMNPETVGVLESYLQSCQVLLGHIKNKDRDGFIQYFKQAAEYFGDFKSEAEKESDYLIDVLAHRQP